MGQDVKNLGRGEGFTVKGEADIIALKQARKERKTEVLFRNRFNREVWIRKYEAKKMKRRGEGEIISEGRPLRNKRTKNKQQPQVKQDNPKTDDEPRATGLKTPPASPEAKKDPIVSENDTSENNKASKVSVENDINLDKRKILEIRMDYADIIKKPIPKERFEDREWLIAEIKGAVEKGE